MTQTAFATTWKGSIQPRKQRKYSYNAPLHVKQKSLHVHLSADLRKKHGLRNIQVKVGDKVRVLRGQYRKKEGKVERVSLKKTKVNVTGLEYVKKAGAKINVGFNPSNLMIIDLDLGDRKRKQIVERAGKNGKKLVNKTETSKKVEKQVETTTKTKKSE